MSTSPINQTIISFWTNTVQTRDYFDATASNWNTSAHRTPWRISLYKYRQSNRRLGVF